MAKKYEKVEKPVMRAAPMMTQANAPGASSERARKRLSSGMSILEAASVSSRPAPPSKKKQAKLKAARKARNR